MRVFISHASVDDAFANRLRQDLCDSSIETWVDHHDVPAGAEWVATVSEALTTCDVMALLLTKESLQSKHVGREWMAFVNSNKPIYPLVMMLSANACQIDCRKKPLESGD